MIADNYTPVKTLGNGVTTEFSFGFALIAEANIRVYLEDVETGVQTLQTLGSDYTVEFDDDTPGGIVTFADAPSEDYYVVIGRDIPKSQTVPLTTSAGFQAKVVEAMVDKAVGGVQDIKEEVKRTLKTKIGGTTDLTVAEPDPGKGLKWNAAGDGIENTVVDADEAAIAAAASAAAALASKNSADADAVATAADRVQTGLDVIQTAADRVQTGLDRVATGEDKVDTAADRVQTGLDVIQTAADRVQTGLDVTAAANYAAALKATSTSSIAIGTGEKTFVTQSGKQFAVGLFVLAVSDADPTNYMHGQVTSYTGTTLVIDVQDIGGSGTKADWTITVSGSRGTQGESGATPTVETKTDDYNVSVNDTGKVLVMDAAGTKTFNLPSVAAGNVGINFTFAKIGAGKLIIDAADSDKIADSGAGDTIYNDQTGEIYATITLILISATQWAIRGADGIWVTTD